MKEVWESVVDGFYLVSNIGRVRRISTGRILRPGIVKGYEQVVLSIHGERRQRKVHKLVAEAFIGPCPMNAEVNHVDGVKRHNVFTNLEYTTQKGNAEHAAKTGLLAQGEAHWCSKLNKGDVYAIRDIYRKGMGGILARKYGVNKETIQQIAKRRTWKHL